MAIFLGTSRTRFPDFQDPNAGVGKFFERARQAASDFLYALGTKTFQNSFVEDGIQEVPGYNVSSSSYKDSKSSYINLSKPTRRAFITQRPKLTVFIKKKQFSTLKDNYDIRFMDESERLYLRAVKSLFRRKCDEIAFYENTINLESIYETEGFLNTDLGFDRLLEGFFQIANVGLGMGSLFASDPSLVLGFTKMMNDAGPVFSQLNANGGSELVSFAEDMWKTLSELYALKKTNDRSKSNAFTTWIDDPSTADFAGLGYGVGVIELNLVSRVNSTVSLNTGNGNATFNIEDPYRLTIINENDIEIAVRRALGQENGLDGLFETSGNLQLKQAQLLDSELNALRAARGVSQVNFEFASDGSGNIIGRLIDFNTEFDKFSLTSIAPRTNDQAFANEEFVATELVRAAQIIELLESYNDLQLKAIGLFQQTNARFNSLRQRMRNEFLGQSIIQPMDAVSVFVNSNTRDDSPLYAGRPDMLLNDVVVNTLEGAEDAISDETIRLEHEQVAPGVPFWLYRSLRNRSMFRDDGVSTFVGLIESVNFSYNASDGSFTSSISAKDNCQYLEISKFNDNPSLAQNKNVLYDPLTPFDLEQDAVTGFVSEIPQLSQENRERLKYLRYDDGPLAGTLVQNANRLFVDSENISDKNITVLQHVPGLVYKWKTDIISASLQMSTATVLNGQGAGLGDLGNSYGFSVYENPFVNLDSADIVSILVTGQPHSYASFLQNALEVGSLSVDNTNNSKAYFNYLFDYIERTRTIYGNFIPAKQSVLSPSEVASVFEAQKTIIGLNSTILQAQKELVNLETQLRTLKGRVQDQSTNINIANAQAQIDKIKNKIVETQAKISSVQANVPEKTSISIAGNKSFVNIDDDAIEPVRRKLKYSLKRKPEEVRYNNDKNYLIVSDKYDYDLDLQAFIASETRRDFNLWSTGSEWRKISEMVSEVASKIDFEFFADHNGNLVFRPPEYNKIPLSLLMRLIEMSAGDGISLMPAYIRDLFTSRIKMAEDESLRLELDIYEKLMLGGQDISLSPGQSNVYTPALTELQDEFVLNNLSLLDQTVSFSDEGSSANAFSSSSSTFGPLAQLSFLESINNSEKIPLDLANKIAKVRATKAKLQMETYTITPETLSAIDNEINQISGNGPDAPQKRLKLKNDISQLVSRRQILARTLRGLLVKSAKAAGADSITKLVPEGLTAFKPSEVMQSLPAYLREMVENDLENEDGWRSGKRFVINDDVILSYDFSNRPPEFNRVDVTGQIPFASTEGGNLADLPLLWAGATDFDSWRQYGLRDPGTSVARPELSNAETQCAPYAKFMLLRQRKEIHSGSITIIGNEFYQVGDVVYVNCKGMLYYVTDVQHDLDLSSGSYRTHLELKYGHALGEYIPTPLDVYGKTISARAQKLATTKINRKSVPSAHIFNLETLFIHDYDKLVSSNWEAPIDADSQTGVSTTSIIGDSSSSYTGDIEAMKWDFIDRNRDKLKNAFMRASHKLNTTSKDRMYSIEIRGYHVGGATTAVSTMVLEWIRSFVYAAYDLPPEVKSNPNLTVNTNISEELTGDNKTFLRFPSADAWAGAKPVLVQTSTRANPLSLGTVPVNAIDIVFVTQKNTKNPASK